MLPGQLPSQAEELLARARQDPPAPEDPPELAEEEEEPQEELLDQQESPASALADDVPPDSKIAELRRQRERIQAKRSTVLSLPHWEEKLGVKLRFADEAQFKKLLRAAGTGDDPIRALRANSNLLIAGCIEVLCRADESDDWEAIVEGESLRFDERLAEVLELGPVKSARDVLIALFGAQKAPWAIARLSGRYSDWLMGEEAQEAASEVGESSSATET